MNNRNANKIRIAKKQNFYRNEIVEIIRFFYKCINAFDKCKCTFS